MADGLLDDIAELRFRDLQLRGGGRRGPARKTAKNVLRERPNKRRGKKCEREENKSLSAYLFGIKAAA